jgi:hypothetical protein
LENLNADEAKDQPLRWVVKICEVLIYQKKNQLVQVSKFLDLDKISIILT